MYHPKLRTEETEASYYAYGWDVSLTNRNTKQVWHNGANNIFYADFLRYIDENITLIMLTNKSHPNFDNLCFDISKMIFNPTFQPEIPVIDNETNRNFTNYIITTIENYGLDSAKKIYKNRKENEHLLEFMMRNEGFNFIDNDRSEIAIQLFKMNVFAHPKSAKALQGLGESFMETGNKEKALKYFKKSLSINPDNLFVDEMIEKLDK